MDDRRNPKAHLRPGRPDGRAGGRDDLAPPPNACACTHAKDQHFRGGSGPCRVKTCVCQAFRGVRR